MRTPINRLCTALYFAAVAAPATAQWTNGQAAFRVLGQTAFGMNASGNSATSMNNPAGIAIDAARSKMYVADVSNNRVLRFAWPVLSNAPTAEIVFGQPSFNVGVSNNGGRSASTMNAPHGVNLGGNGTLYVCDTGNNRILAFPNADLVSTNGVAASRVLGQMNFTDGSPATTAGGMYDTRQATWEAPDRLWVGDGYNRRVLRFENVSNKANGASADGVLGQPDFVSSIAAVTAAGLKNPDGVTVVSGTLYISDYANKRILRHIAAATKPNGATADGVLGQPNFTSSGSATSASGLRGAYYSCSDTSGRLYVADVDNRRIIIHADVNAKANGAAADNVLGQSTFTTASAGGSASNLGFPYGVAVDGASGIVAIADTFSNRVVLQQASSPLPVSVSAVAVD